MISVSNLWITFNILIDIVGTLYILGSLTGGVMGFFVTINYKNYAKQIGSEEQYWTWKDTERIFITMGHSWIGVWSILKATK